MEELWQKNKNKAFYKRKQKDRKDNYKQTLWSQKPEWWSKKGNNEQIENHILILRHNVSKH